MSKSTSFDEFQLFDEANFLFDAFDPFKDCGDLKDDPQLISDSLLSQSWHSSKDSFLSMPQLHIDAEHVSSMPFSLDPPSNSNKHMNDQVDSSLAYLSMYNSSVANAPYHSSSKSVSHSRSQSHSNNNASRTSGSNGNGAFPSTTHSHSHSRSQSQTQAQVMAQSGSVHLSDSQSSQTHYHHSLYASPIPMQQLDPSSSASYNMPLPNRPFSASPLVNSRSPMPIVEITPGYQMILPAQSSCQSDFRIGSPAPSTTSSRKEPDNDSLLSRSPSLFSIGSPTPSFTGSISEQSLTKRDRNRIAAEKCRKKKNELITTLTQENEILQQKKNELEKSNQALEQRLDYLINVMASYGISIPSNKTKH